MEYVIATYRSRSVSVRVYNYLVSNGVTASLVSTPRQANVGCGLSVRFGRDVLATFGNVLATADSFVGFFVIKNTARGTTVAKL